MCNPGNEPRWSLCVAFSSVQIVAVEGAALTRRVLFDIVSGGKSKKIKKENRTTRSASLFLDFRSAFCFVWFGECDIRPRHFESRWIGGPGRG